MHQEEPDLWASIQGQIGELSEPPEAEIGLQLNTATYVLGVCRPPGMALKPADAILPTIYTR
jgi:hypothetical protein